MIFIAFTVVCVPVFGIAFYFFVRALLIGNQLSQRANAMVPRTLLAQLNVAQIDAKRIPLTFKAISALAPRAAIASASILSSINTYRALLARLRDLA
jgi:hypothetical protein